MIIFTELHEYNIIIFILALFVLGTQKYMPCHSVYLRLSVSLSVHVSDDLEIPVTQTSDAGALYNVKPGLNGDEKI